MPTAVFPRSAGSSRRHTDLQRSRSLDGTVAALIRNRAAAWNRTPDRLPATLPVFPRPEQERNEQAAGRLLKRWSTGRHPSRRDATSRILALMTEVDQRIAADRDVCRRILEEMAETGHRFTREVRSFDDSLPAEGLAQALRNLWVMNSIQLLCAQPVRLTPSCFAYSLLYPYTDNLLDDHRMSLEDKRSFNRWLAGRLDGRPGTEPPVAQARRIEVLIAMIEREWPRDRFPLVYGGLLAIHAAQTEGVRLHRAARPLSADTVLRLTLAKGGTSVLAHGYLLQGTLPAADRRWIFGFGTVLQMIDDLQDLQEDRARQHLTLFAGCRSPEHLSLLINRLLGYAEETVAGFPAPNDVRRRTLLRLIRGSCVTLVCEAIAALERSLPASYGSLLEAHSPICFAALRSFRDRAGDLLTSKTLDMFRETPGHPVRPLRLVSAL